MNISYEVLGFNSLYTLAQFEFFSFVFNLVMFFKLVFRIWCGVSRLGDSGVHTLDDTSAFVNPASQLLLTRRGKTRMDGVGIVLELYIYSPSLS